MKPSEYAVKVVDASIRFTSSMASSPLSTDLVTREGEPVNWRNPTVEEIVGWWDRAVRDAREIEQEGEGVAALFTRGGKDETH